MIYRTLGRTGLHVSLASLGTGGPSRLGQGTHNDEAIAHRVVRRALELGVNLFDTAANYGDSEVILGRALRDVPRSSYLVATKFYPYHETGVITPAELIASCERSLQRLGVDVLDLYQFHSVVPESYHDVVDRLYPTAQKLREQGKIRFLGITEYFFPDPCHRMLEMALGEPTCLWDTIMVKYGILNLSAERKVLPWAQAHDVGVLNMSPVRVKLTRPAELEKVIARWKTEGLLAADALPERNPLDFLVGPQVPSVVAAGYKFGVGHEAIDTVLFGTGSVAHLEENIEAIVGPPLSQANLDRIRALFGPIVQSEGDTA